MDHAILCATSHCQRIRALIAQQRVTLKTRRDTGKRLGTCYRAIAVSFLQACPSEKRVLQNGFVLIPKVALRLACPLGKSVLRTSPKRSKVQKVVWGGHPAHNPGFRGRLKTVSPFPRHFGIRHARWLVEIPIELKEICSIWVRGLRCIRRVLHSGLWAVTLACVLRVFLVSGVCAVQIMYIEYIR